MGAEESPVQRASAEFVAEFVRWRLRRGLSKKQVAQAMGFDPSYVSHIEARRHQPTVGFARRAEAILQTGGELLRRFDDYGALRSTAAPRPGALAADLSRDAAPVQSGLVIEREDARLVYRNGTYWCEIRRVLDNTGVEPITRYPVNISVDRFPDDPGRSNQHHHRHPLTWQELAFEAYCDAEPMDWLGKTDRDADKEVWLLFENTHGRFPLYPGQRATVTHTYRVGADKWGPWFQRIIRIPTRNLSIAVDFPESVHPVVWGAETSMSAEAAPLRTPVVTERPGNGRVVYSWRTDRLTLNTRYRLEWRFRVPPGTRPGAALDALPSGRPEWPLAATAPTLDPPARLLPNQVLWRPPVGADRPV